MGSYYIPSNKLKGESRILYIFTGKSLIYTAIGGLIGLIIYFICAILNAKTAGIIIMALMALMGYGLGTIKMPTNGNSKLSRNVGGDSLDEIIKNYVLFKKNKKVYTYAIPRKDPDYLSNNQLPLDLSNLLENRQSNKGGK